MNNRVEYLSSINNTGLIKVLKISSLFLILFVSSSLRAQVGPGDNLWNVNCYANLAADANTLPSGYMGYYTQKLDVTENYGFNTTLSWTANLVPSDAKFKDNADGIVTKYSGNVFSYSSNANSNKKFRYFSYIHKRKGFPKAKYKITMRVWDDNTYLFIDGIRIPFSGDAGFGDNRMVVNCFELNSKSIVEVRTGNDGGNDTQCILDIVKTDIMFAETLKTQDVCENTNIMLDAKIKVDNTNFTQDVYWMNFDSGSFAAPSGSGWAVGTSGSANSGSRMMYASIFKQSKCLP